MSLLLRISRLIDGLNQLVGKLAMWLVLAATLISAGNAIVRKVIGASSNSWLEIQWYLFGTVFMLGAGYAFLVNAHVRIDFISSRFSARTRNWVDIGGILLFLVPLCWLMIGEGWPLFERAWTSGEMSGNADGLIRWPVYLLIPAGFALLLLQVSASWSSALPSCWARAPTCWLPAARAMKSDWRRNSSKNRSACKERSDHG